MSTQKRTKKETTAQSINANYNALQPVDIGYEGEGENFSSVPFAISVRALRQNWRQGTVACKGRSDVAFSNKKPWKQKGTGRARAGSRRSPIWRSGGVSFGPQPRTRTLTVTKNAKRYALRHVLSHFLQNSNVIQLQNAFDIESPSTSYAYKLLKSANLHTKKINVFVNPHDLVTYASFVNLPNVRVLFFDQPNTFELAHADCWVFLAKDMDYFKDMVATWR
ncbi:50S ribosomal protein L4 [Vermiphilus pyriformis]|nr:MAG: 50S ribosomal protein L4 [Vermiphilus pyriformis]